MHQHNPPYEVIHLGGQAAAIVPLAELRRQVRQVEEYIATHWNAPFDIEEIASLTGMSARSIYRAFKRTRGYSPKAFARQRRLQQARLLLEEDPRDQNVTSVAFACGYTDASHFSREFSKAYGEAPSAILARNRRAAP